MIFVNEFLMLFVNYKEKTNKIEKLLENLKREVFARE
jgi:hypothetical protein